MGDVPDLLAALTALAECSPSAVGTETQQLLRHVEGAWRGRKMYIEDSLDLFHI